MNDVEEAIGSRVSFSRYFRSYGQGLRFKVPVSVGIMMVPPWRKR